MGRAVAREAARTYFQDEARLILSAERGLTPRAQAMLVGTARRYGLSPAEAEDALTALMPPATDHGGAPSRAGPPPAAPVPPPPATASGKPPVSAAAEPRAEAPEPPPQPPAETFRRYLGEVLQTLSRPALSERKERKLIEQGVEKLRLSRALARQVLYRVAEERGVAILSRSSEAADDSAGTAVDDPQHWEEFRSRAAAILAEQRGINARSRMLLEAAAEELSVPAEQIDRAVASLRPADQKPVQTQIDIQERVSDYRQYLDVAMARLEHGPVTARIQQRWLDEARERFGVDAEQASQVIRRVAADQGVRVIREHQAEEHLLALMRRSKRIEHLPREDLLRRLYREGEQWGLTAEQIRGLIEIEDRRQRRWQTIRSAALLALIGLPLVGGLALLTILAAARRESADGTHAAGPPGEHRPPPPPSIHAPTGREWWAQDPDLLAAVTRLRTAYPPLEKPLQALNVEDADQRAGSHTRLVQAAAARSHDEAARGPLTGLVAGCLAAEPSDACADAIAAALLEYLPQEDQPLPRDLDFLEPSYWAAETFAAALARGAMPEYRRQSVANLVGGRLGIALDLTQPETLRFDLPAALVRSQLRWVVSQAAEDPLLALPLFQGILERGQRHLDRAALERARLDLLLAALPATGSSWREYAPLLQRTVHADSPLIVLELADLLDRVEDPELQEELAAQLLLRVGQDPRDAAPSEAARRVRDALGASLPVTGEQRWRQLQRMAEPLLSPDTETSGAEQQLQRMVDLGRAATLAAALASGEPGTAAFDQLMRQGDYRLVAATSGQGDGRQPAPEELTTRQERYQRQAQEYARYFGNSRSRPAQRIVMLRNLSALASQLPRLPTQSAIQVAAYLLSAKGDEEHQEMLALIPAIARWKQVRLALADEVLETSLQQERVERVVARAIRNPGLLKNDGDWKQNAYRALLEDVLRELPDTSSDRGPPLNLYDDACDYLREFYQVQAHLAGVPVEQYAEARSPSLLLKLMIETTAARLSGTAIDPAADSWLQELPHRLVASAHAAAGNDLLHTLLLQRTWIRLAALDLGQRMPDKAAAVDAYLAALPPLDRAADSIIGQLGDGERVLLQMWRLTAPPGS